MQVPCRGQGPPPQARESRYRVDNARRIHYLSTNRVAIALRFIGRRTAASN